jgi:O-antigen/teichoic acid export membrane protein
VASLALQLLVARTLGADGLGTYALLYSFIILATAIATGLVGDSLTVLERGEQSVRAGLQLWCLGIAAGTALAGLVVTGVTGYLSWTDAWLYASAIFVFIFVDCLRRLLMAALRFWRIIVVDGALLVVSTGVAAVDAQSGGLTIGGVLAALVAGLTASLATAVLLLPRQERWLAPWRPADVRKVAGFGLWRAAQQCIRPGTLAAARVVVSAIAGRAAFGQLEAARLVIAPAQLIVSGIGSYLLASYAHSKTKSTASLLRTADATFVGLLVVSLALGAVAAAATPALSDLVTSGQYSVDSVAVFGWAIYAASTASVMPFATLAAVRGKQASVFLVKLVEAAASLLMVAAAVRMHSSWAPYGLAAGPLVAGILVRQWLLVPLARSERLTAQTPLAAAEA